jgi:hypothetical protein
VARITFFAFEPRDLVLLHQEVQALDVLGDDRVLALEHGGPVERGRAEALNAKIGGVLQMVPDFGVEEQSLGGNAAHMQAGSAQLRGRLDERHLEPILRRANRRRVAGRPAADDRHVVDRLCRLFSQGKLHSGARRKCPTRHLPLFSLADAAGLNS